MGLVQFDESLTAEILVWIDVVTQIQRDVRNKRFILNDKHGFQYNLFLLNYHKYKVQGDIIQQKIDLVLEATANDGVLEYADTVKKLLDSFVVARNCLCAVESLALEGSISRK